MGGNYFFVRRTVALAAGAIALLASTAWPGSSLGATVRVTNQHNGGPGSLRRALASAHPGDTIVVPAGTYRLTSQLVVNRSVTVNGAGPGKTILTAGDASRVIDITNSAATVTLTALDVTHGEAPLGAGILNIGNLTLRNVAVTANLAAGGDPNVGGGIANSGTLTIQHSQITANKTAAGSAQGWGGGIADTINQAAGSLTISRSVISGNVAQGNALGGALFFEPVDPPDGTHVSISTTTLANNKSLVDGGGIFYEPILNSGSPQISLTLSRDTFLGNIATGGSTGLGLGGAVLYGSVSNTTATLSLTLVNDTFTRNRAGSSSADGFGGALYVEPTLNQGSMAQKLTNLTIARNVADGSGGTGGGVLYDPTGSTSGTFFNSIIALNTATNGPDCSGPVPSSGHNLERQTSCGFSNAIGDKQNTDPGLGFLAKNGGPTETLALLSGSAAINAGGDLGCPSIDQRGIPRPQGTHCDIGAYERKP